MPENIEKPSKELGEYKLNHGVNEYSKTISCIMPKTPLFVSVIIEKLMRS